MPAFSRNAVALVWLLSSLPALGGPPPASISIDRKLQMLRVRRGKHPYRRMVARAGKLLGEWKITLADVEIDGAYLQALARKAPGEPFVRVIREQMRRPVDMDDLVFFLDDVLRAGRRGLRGKLVWMPAGRARAAGILVHPQDVFRKNRPRVYAGKKDLLHIDKPVEQLDLEPAADGAPLGPDWTVRYKNPWTREAKLEALAEKSTSGTFSQRTAWLIRQLEEQGCEVALYTTVRNRHRGYLMWGAFRLSRKKTRRDVMRTVRDLERVNERWRLNVPIRWLHPAGWRATIEAARRMNDAYGVVYATRTGARESRHYDGEAIDITAVGLPRKLTLEAPSGARQSFDLSDPLQPRDLNLTPELVDWIEKHFQMEKLEMDYPHWNDTAPRIREPEKIPD
ncbi:MAG: hypothetical protein JXR96_14255 [Deltaproteobacteria bacterium]|nr:hypothetical protein [Deltaproteobacteria bacterium]